jgi:hypothetical protein
MSMLNSPSRKFLLYLLLVLNKSPEQAEQLGHELNIPTISLAYLYGLKAAYPPPPNFNPSKPKGKATAAFLKACGITGLACQDEHTESALSLMLAPRLREVIESMLLCYAANDTIAAFLKKHFRVEYDSKVIDAYRRFVFDPNVETRPRLKAVLEMHACPTSRNGQPLPVAEQRALRDAWLNDARKLALSLPPVQETAEAVKLRLGFPPGHVDKAQTLKRIRDNALILCQINVIRGTTFSARVAVQLIDVATKATELLNEITDPSEKLRTELAGFKLLQSTGKLPHIDELGEHTVNLVDLDPKKQPS